MDRRTRSSLSASWSRRLYVECLEGRILFSAAVSIPAAFGALSLPDKATSVMVRTDDLPGAHSNQSTAMPTSNASARPERDGKQGNGGLLELHQGIRVEQATGAPAGFNPRILDQLFSAARQTFPPALAALSDADTHQPGQDHDDAVSESSERQQLAMLSAASQASQWTHSMSGMPGWEGDEPDENTNGQLTQERPIQMIGPYTTPLPALLVSMVSVVEAPTRPVSARPPQALDDLIGDTPIPSEAEKLSSTVESAELTLAAGAPLTISCNLWPLAPLPGVPVRGYLPFDMETLTRGVDKLVDQLANLGQPWNDPQLGIEIAFWLTTVTAAVFEFARYRAGKSLCRSFLENNVRCGLAPGMEHEL
jgi:hypothetical protein